MRKKVVRLYRRRLSFRPKRPKSSGKITPFLTTSLFAPPPLPSLPLPCAAPPGLLFILYSGLCVRVCLVLASNHCMFFFFFLFEDGVLCVLVFAFLFCFSFPCELCMYMCMCLCMCMCVFFLTILFCFPIHPVLLLTSALVLLSSHHFFLYYSGVLRWETPRLRSMAQRGERWWKSCLHRTSPSTTKFVLAGKEGASRTRTSGKRQEKHLRSQP